MPIIETIRSRLFPSATPFQIEYHKSGLVHELKKLHDALQDNWEEFPFTYCWDAARMIERSLGLPMIEGKFRVDLAESDDTGLERGHAWNSGPLDYRVDITLYQFNDWMLPRNKIRDEVVIAQPGSPLYQRYLPKDIKV